MAELRNYTSLRVGGPAKNFVDAHNESEIIAAIEAAGDTPVLICLLYTSDAADE